MKDCCKEIEFNGNRVAYCSVCGTKHNKERLGKSMYDYAGHKGDTAFKRYTEGTLYFKLSNYNGVGQEFLNYVEYRPVKGSGNLDVDGGAVCFKNRSINLSRTLSGRGKGKKKGLDRVSFNHSFTNPKTEEFGGTTNADLTDEDIFDTTDEEFNNRVIRKMQPAFYKRITKLEFDIFEAKIQHISNELSELCTFKKEH